MFIHQPPDYICPFCDWLAGNETEYKQNSDIVYQDGRVTAFISPKWWTNPGNVIVIPNHHYENLYILPDKALEHTMRIVKRVAIAMRRCYDCTGTSIRQHNEPDGNQDVWHFPVHVLPRSHNDRLYQNHDRNAFAPPAARAVFAEKLRPLLNL